MSSIFRNKDMDSVNSPDELEEYIQVTTPSIWLLIIALGILVLGLLAFSIFGTVTGHTESGAEELIHPITFLLN